MEARRGETPQAARCTSSCASHWETGSTAIAVVWPIRRSRFGLEASEARSAPGAKVSATGAAEKKVRRPRRDDAPKAVRRDQFAAGAVIDCNWSITPGSTNTQACSAAIGTLNT